MPTFGTARERERYHMDFGPDVVMDPLLEQQEAVRRARMIAHELTKGVTNRSISYDLAAQVAETTYAVIAMNVAIGNITGNRKKKTVIYSSLDAWIAHRPKKVANTGTTEPEDR